MGLTSKFSYKMEKNYIEKTNLVLFGRGNRKAAAEAKYHLYDNFRNKNLAPNVVYIIHDLGHLKHLKNIFKN